MKTRGRFGVMSFVLAAGIVDSRALAAAVFAAVVNFYGTHPVLSTWTMLLAVVMLVVLAITAVVDEGLTREEPSPAAMQAPVV